MNIFEAYLKMYKQCIILILGMPCTNKSDIAKELGNDLSIPIIKINDYLIKDKFKEVEEDGYKFKLYEHTDAYDWDSFNQKVNELKSNGVIIYGNYLDEAKIDFKINYSFMFEMNNKLCKKILIDKKMLPFQNDDPKLDIYFLKIFNPLYDNLKKNITINKFINIKEDTIYADIFDKIFQHLINYINKNVYKK